MRIFERLTDKNVHFYLSQQADNRKCCKANVCGVMNFQTKKINQKEGPAMTHSNNKNPVDAPAEKQQDQVLNNGPVHSVNNNNIKILNLRWQEIRKWELNRLRVQELNHHLAFMRQSLKQNLKSVSPLKAKNDPTY